MRAPVISLMAENNPSIVAMFWQINDTTSVRPINGQTYRGYRTFNHNTINYKYERFGCEVVVFNETIKSSIEREVPEEVQKFVEVNKFSDLVFKEFERSLKNDSLQNLEGIRQV